MEGMISVKKESEEINIQGAICTLCVEKCENFKAIDGNTKNILDSLLLKIDFTAIQGPVICTNCEGMLMKWFDFKTTCLHTQNYIAPFLKDKDHVKLDLRDVYLSRNVTGSGVPENQDICGFCMGLVKNGFIVSFDVEEGDVMLGKMIKQCLPELDLSIIKKSVICASCHESLQGYFHFVMNCLIVREKITKHCEVLYINDKPHILHNSPLQFVTTEVDCNSSDIIKVEESYYDDKEDVGEREIGSGADTVKLKKNILDDREDDIKNVENESKSFMEMNDQAVNSEEQFTPDNILTYSGENNILDSIKIEEVFCGENETEHKEESVFEMEEEKFLLNEETKIKTDEHYLHDRFEDGIVSSQLEDNRELHRREESSVLNLGRDQSNVYLQTTHEKPLVNHNLIPGDFKKRLPIHENPSKLVIYNCNSCSFQTRNKHCLKDHTLTHKDLSEVTTYKCVCCSFQTIRKYNLKRHLLTHEDPSKVTMFKCNCSFQTKHKSSLKDHMLVHKDRSEITMHKCNFCSYQARHKNVLKKHLILHENLTEITIFICDSCSFQTKYKPHLKRHLLMHKDPSEITMYKCDSCSFQTKYKHYLKKHLIVHQNPSEVTMYKCDSCSFQTKHKRHLKRHLLMHKDPSEITMYKCDHCLFQTKYKLSLKDHLLTHKNPSEVTMYKCDSCSFQTKNKQYFKKHLIMHENPSEVTMYKCHSCLHQTKHKGDLIKHLLKHKDSLEVTLHKCGSCSFQTKHKSNLKRHLLTHKDPSEVTMYKCDHCSFQTEHKYRLKPHQLTHKSLKK